MQKNLKPIRSFVRRGRITDSQRQALVSFSERYLLKLEDGIIDFKRVFSRKAPIIVEIGFGKGEVLLDQAKSHLYQDYIGIEVHRPGVGALMSLLDQECLSNVRIYCEDAVQVIKKCIPARSLNGIHLFFPDPWPKNRHHKRRLIQPEFMRHLASKLREGAYVHIATDCEDYARHIETIMDSDPRFIKSDKSKIVRLQTRFEQRAIRLGHAIMDLVYFKK